MDKKEYNGIMESLLDTEKAFAPFIIDADQYKINGLLVDVFCIQGSQKEYSLIIEPVKNNGLLGLFKLRLYTGNDWIDTALISYNDIYKDWLITLEDFLEKNKVGASYV